MAEEELKIVIDDGTVDVPIYNVQGDKVGHFKFRPTDVDIISRFNEVANRFEEVVEPIKDTTVNKDGEGVTEEDSARLEQAKAKLFELVDYLFGGEVSKGFFGSMNPFSPVDGNYYCENVINAVGELISKKFDEQTKKINARVDKYTHGYKTGAHKDGKRK